MFSFNLDVSRINAQSVFCLNTGKHPRTGVDSRKFGWTMAKGLLMPYMRRRKAESGGLNKSIMLKLNMFLPDVEEDEAGHGRGDGDDVHAGEADHVARGDVFQVQSLLLIVT